MPCGCCEPSNVFAWMSTISLRSDCFAVAGRLARSATASTAERALTLARLILGVHGIEKLQVLGVEIGAHANAIHCRGSLNDPGRFGGLQAVLLGPRGH